MCSAVDTWSSMGPVLVLLETLCGFARLGLRSCYSGGGPFHCLQFLYFDRSGKSALDRNRVRLLDISRAMIFSVLGNLNMAA